MSKPIQVEDYVLEIMHLEAKEEIEYGELMVEKGTLEYVKNIMQQAIDNVTHPTNIEYKDGKMIRNGKTLEVPKETIEMYLERKRKEREAKSQER